MPRAMSPDRWPVPVRKQLKSTYRVSRRSEGGNPGEYSSESPEGEEDGQDDPGNVKDRVYNRRMPGKGGEFS